MNLGRALTLRALLTLILILHVIGICGYTNLNIKAQNSSEYERYVRMYTIPGRLGNWTYMQKPMFPIFFNSSQILVGQNWSVVCPLLANHSYHVYCYGEWVTNGSEPRTDYDIYVYNPLGEMEDYNTESAGLPEQVSTSAKEALFMPKLSGNYTFVIVNDPRESKEAQQATFMIIENIQCNTWHKRYIEGKDENDLPVFNTSWAYEFVTESQRFELWVKVPETLDMYEARIYLMTDPQSKNKTILNGIPLPWEPGLFGERKKNVGGYNLESKEYRGLAYASCEFYGQDMFINFTSPYPGKNLYHLVFIGEKGSGTIEFMIKTEFNVNHLKPYTIPTKVYPNNDTVIAYISNLTDLKNATLQYSINNWENVSTAEMEIVDGRVCRGIIPGQEAGALINYRVKAYDMLENLLLANGSYIVKYPSTLNISLIGEVIRLGENITVKGRLTPQFKNASIIIYFTSTNQSMILIATTMEGGTFEVSMKPETLGKWNVQAEFEGNKLAYGSTSQQLTVNVEESLLKRYSLYVGGGIGAAVAIGVALYIRKIKR
ncbi:MAG: hypothetical protein QXZ25_03015 [Candidatus Bathyarchaeia archaeon]